MSESALVRGQPTKRKRFPMDETEREMVQKKVDLLNLADVLGMSEACRVLGFSTASYYRFKKAYETGGAIALRRISRRKPMVKRRVEPQVEEAVAEMPLEQSAFGPASG